VLSAKKTGPSGNTYNSPQMYYYLRSRVYAPEKYIFWIQNHCRNDGRPLE
jgi:hypothetical protein